MRERWCLKMIALGCGDSKVGIFDWQQLGTQATGDTPDNQTSPASTASCPRSHSRSSETRCGEWHVWNRGRRLERGPRLRLHLQGQQRRGRTTEIAVDLSEGEARGSQWMTPVARWRRWRAAGTLGLCFNLRARNEADKWYCIKLLHFSTKY